MKNRKINLFKLGILLFGISLFLLNCEKENDFEQESQVIDNSIPLETVSIDEAKNTLNSLILKSKSTANKSDENLVIVDPDWSTIKQDSMKYSDALLTHAKATFKNSNNNKTADILFIKVDEEVISVLYSTFPMDEYKEILYITELNGDFIDSYIVEDGLLVKRLFFTKEENSSQKQAKTQQRMDYPLGCDDIMNIVDSLNDIFGFAVSSCSGAGGNGGSYNIYGNFGTMSFDGITITATGANQRRNNSNQDNINQDCETSNCDDDQDTRGGGSNTTRIRTEADRQREMAARIAAQEKKCKDKGMLYVKGECVIDTESPCPIEGMIRNNEGKCVKPCPDGFVRGDGVNSLKCVKVPCKGNPIEGKLEVAPQKGKSKTKGALHGCNRYGGSCTGGTNGRNKTHAGIDIKSSYGSPIYAMYDGFIFSDKYDSDGAGYYTRIQSTANGKTFIHEYYHLQKENRILQGNPLVKVKAGDIIGYQGDSGNLKNAIKNKTVESHVHIEIREHNGSNKWGYKNFNNVDPRTYFSTKIKDDGTSETNTNCN